MHSPSKSGNGVKPGPGGRHWRVISGSVHLHTAATQSAAPTIDGK